MSKDAIQVLKAEYNQYLMREVKAEIYLDDEAIPVIEREKHMPAFQAIVKRLNEILYEFIQMGAKYTVKEVTGGFAIE